MALVGRDTELRSISAALAEARTGGFRAVVITGEPGIGKTTLLAAAVALAQADGMHVFRERAATHEREVPFALAAALLDDQAHRAAPATLASFGEELATLLPSAPTAHAGGRVPGSAGERFRYHRALRALLDDVAGSKPFVLALDDLQWADEASFEWLRHLLHRPPRAPAAVLLCARPGPAALTLAADAREDGEQVALGPLAEAAALELLTEVPDAALARRLASQAGGNPLFLRELGRAAARGSGALPPTLVAVVRQEIADVTDPARRLLAAGAVGGDPFDDALAAAVAGLAPDEAASALDALVAADLVRPSEHPRRFAFRHPLVHRAVYDALPPGRRQQLHRRTAEALVTRGASAALRAPHIERSAAGGDAEAIGVLEAAAAAASDTAPAVAAGWYAAALRLLGDADPARRHALLAARGRALAAAGEPMAALSAFDAAAALAHDAATQAFAAQVERLLGRIGAARTRLLGALDHAVGEDRARLELELAATAFTALDADGTLWHARRAVDAWPAGREAVATIPAALEAFSRVLAGEAPAEVLQPVEERVLALGDGEVADPAAWVGLVAVQSGRFASGSRLLARAVAAGRVRRRDHVLPQLRISRAIALGFDLRPVEALEEAEAAEDGARLQGVAVQAGIAGSTRALALDLLGRDADARVAAAASLADLAGADSGLVSRVPAAIALGILHAHDPERLLAEVPQRVGPAFASASSLLGPLVRAALATGQRAQAEAWVTRVAAGLPRLGAPASRVRVDCAHAELRLAVADAAAARRHADAAVARAEAAGLALDGVRARIVAGRAATAAGDRDAALTSLEGALADATRAGADGVAAEAARALRAGGLRMSARALRAATPANSAPGELTGRERAIAELVANGRSNKEVAGALFVSAKTVENNLSRIYAKLGVRSRTELALALAEPRSRSREHTGGFPSF